MGALGSWALATLASVWQWFFPPKTEIPESMRAELQALFPNLDLDRVRVHRGVPLLVRFSWPDAMTLPGMADTSTIHVYVRPRILDSRDCETFSYLAHEFVHVQQYLAYANGRGIGLYRAFWYLYLVCALRFGYKQNPMENEAERFETKVDDRCTTTDSGMIELCCDDIVFRGTEIGFLDQFGRAVPGLQWLWNTVEGLLNERPSWPGRGSGGSDGSANRGRALLIGPVFVTAAGLLSVLGLTYVSLFALLFLLLTSTALSLWYVAKGLYVVVSAGGGVVCLVLMAMDAVVAMIRQLA